MRVLFTVCGRAGSKGIKGKNFREFLGYPLLYYTFSAIDLYCERNMDTEADIAMNTDSTDMVVLLEGTKLKVHYIARKEELMGDYVPKVAVIMDTLREMEVKMKKQYDMVVDCDITAPLRTVSDIKNIIEKHSEGSWDVTFSVTDARKNPYFNMVKLDEDGSAKLVISSNFTARQQAPVLYDMNASLYVYKPKFLKSGKHLFDGRCCAVKMMDTAVLDLDNENDFELMQVIAKYMFRMDAYGEIQKHIVDFTIECANIK